MYVSTGKSIEGKKESVRYLLKLFLAGGLVVSVLHWNSLSRAENDKPLVEAAALAVRGGLVPRENLLQIHQKVSWGSYQFISDLQRAGLSLEEITRFRNNDYLRFYRSVE